MTLQKQLQTDFPPLGVEGSPDEVVILMAVYDGADCLGEQLESFTAQNHGNWQLLVSDDGSRDDSPAVLQTFARHHHGQVTCLEGPRQGAAQNFLFLVREAGRQGLDGRWLAFSDQDDVWLPDRLSRGIAALSEMPEDQPALYCSRTWVTDHSLKTRRLSAARPRAPGFRNALIQNIASGNTILLNPAAARLVIAASEEVEDLVVHDWWTYQLITGAGGRVIHDDTPTLLYRQHTGNLIGANDKMRGRARRIRQLLRGDFHKWNNINIKALQASAHRLTPENRAILEGFADLRTRRLPERLRRLAGLRLYRQTGPATLAMWMAATLRRL